MSGGPWTSTERLAVRGTGLALPGGAVSSTDLIATIEARFAPGRARHARALADRLAIRTRHLCRNFDAACEEARPGDANPDLAARAVVAALDDAGLEVGALGYLIAHTATPLHSLPPNVASVADRLEYRGPFIELRQACTGFANALVVAHGLVAAGHGPVAIVGSETGSLFFDPYDAAVDDGQLVNMMQMGDGAGAVIVDAPGRGRSEIRASWFGCTGLHRTPGIARGGAHRFEHDFAAIAASGGALFDAGRAAAEALGLSPDAATHIVPHQVSGRIGSQAARRFGVEPGRVFVNADRYGNTGSAAIWIAFAELRKQLRTDDDVVVLGAEASKFMYGGFAYRHG